MLVVRIESVHRGEEFKMSNPGKVPVDHGLVPVDLKSAKEPLPHQTVMKIFSISIIAQGLPFCRRRVSLQRLKV